MKKMNGRADSSRSASDRRPWLILGNPDNRRIKLFQAALREHLQPRAEVVSYVDFLRGRVDLEAKLEKLAAANGIFRIESPGEDFEVERLLIARGYIPTRRASEGAAQSISASSALRLRDDPGRVRFPRQWFAGFSSVLEELAAAAERHPQVQLQSGPDEIRRLFDKSACHARLADHNVAVPQSLPRVSCYEELREAMRAANLSRVFVKLNGGSSSSGVVAFSTGSYPLAVTSLELVRQRGETRFYNNLTLTPYDRERDLQAIFDFLCREGAHVEQWLPKITQDGRNLDLRVVTIAGRAQHIVVRTSLSPLTNLHLGNRRGDLDALRRAAGDRWNIIPELCEQAAAAFPRALCIGWDVLITPGFRRAYILEGNAFGDLLPNVLHDGRSTYSQIVAALRGAQLQ